MKVTVTQEDIDKGRPQVRHGCPIAIAVKRINKSNKVWIGRLIAFIDETCYQLPNTAIQFVKDFDSNKPVEPFSFVMYDYDY